MKENSREETNWLVKRKRFGRIKPESMNLLDNSELLMTLTISQRTALRWRAEGRLPYIRIGRKIYYRKADIDKLMNSNYLKNPKC